MEFARQMHIKTSRSFKKKFSKIFFRIKVKDFLMENKFVVIIFLPKREQNSSDVLIAKIAEVIFKDNFTY